jgi:hypothetical protein
MVNSLNWQVPLAHLSANHSVEADCHSLIWFPLAQVLYIIIMEAMNEDLIAPCGMNCALCASYLVMKNDLKRKGFRRRTAPAAYRATGIVTTKGGVNY